jgi:hypothetical protein
MFSFATVSPSASGTVTDSAGNPVPNQAMILTVGAITLSTFTNSHGQYNFYGAAPGQGTIAVGNQQFPAAVGRVNRVRRSASMLRHDDRLAPRLGPYPGRGNYDWSVTAPGWLMGRGTTWVGNVDA